MATYDYECQDCSARFEVEHPMSEKPTVLHCGDTPALRVLNGMLRFTYGKESFHGPTIGEQMEDNKKHWEREGLVGDDAPVPAADKYRWV